MLGLIENEFLAILVLTITQILQVFRFFCPEANLFVRLLRPPWPYHVADHVIPRKPRKGDFTWTHVWAFHFSLDGIFTFTQRSNCSRIARQGCRTPADALAVCLVPAGSQNNCDRSTRGLRTTFSSSSSKVRIEQFVLPSLAPRQNS